MAENQVEDGDLEEATEKSEGAGNAGNAASDSTRDGWNPWWNPNNLWWFMVIAMA